MKTLLCLLAFYTTSKALKRTIIGTRGDNVILKCPFNETNLKIHWSRGSLLIITEMKINPNFKGKYRLNENSSTGEYKLQVLNLDQPDEGTYQCSANINGLAYIERLYLTITVTRFLKNESSTKQVDDNIQHISVRDFIIVVALIVCVSFVTSFCCVVKIRHQIIQRSYNVENPLVFSTTTRSRNGIAIELNEDHHLYHEINELEQVNPSGEGIFIPISDPELDNVERQLDDDDYLHPYHSLIDRSHIDDHKYEDLVIPTSYNYICDAVGVNINRCTHKQLRDTFKLNRFGDNKKIMFYSEPFNLHKYMFQYSLTQSDIKVKRQGNKSLDKILNVIGVKHTGIKQIDDNISLD